jgi:hypothetical protein
MLSIRRWILVVAVLAVLAVWSAPLAAAPVLGIKGAGEDADKWLLPDAEVVMTINVKQLVGSDLMKANLPKIKDLMKNNEQIKAVLDATGLDPFKDITSILVSGSGSTAKDAKALIVVKGKFDADKIHTALKKEAEKKEKEGEIELVTEGGKQLYKFKSHDQALFAGFAGSSILVMTPSKEATLDAIKNGGRKTVKMSKEMRDALATFTGKESLTVATVVTDELKKTLEKAPQVGKAAAKLKTLTAALTVTNEVSLNINGATSEAKAAEQLSRGLSVLKAAAGVATDELPPIVGEILEAIKITSANENVTIALKITKEMLEKANKQDK